MTNGYLELGFRGRNVGPLYDNSIEWMVNGLIIQNLGQSLTIEAEIYLGRGELVSDSAIRDWYVIGPFDDDDCRGLDVVYGPELSTDITKTYPGKAGTVAWQHLSALTGKAPYVSLPDTFADIYEVAGFALSHVYCPSETQAKLICSMSQAGEVYVNGEVVCRDELAAGLFAQEQILDVTLKSGWNSILIKSLNHWGDTWSLHAGLMTAGQQPLADQPGIVISASAQGQQ